MAIPANLTTITLTGEFLTTTGAPMTGTLNFTPPPELVDVNTAIMYAAPDTVTLDASGRFTTTLICTDNPTLAPAGWSYTVQENVSSPRSYSIFVPSTLGSTVDLSTLVPLPTLTGGTTYATTMSAISPGYAALAYGNTFTGTNTFTGPVSFADLPTLPGGLPTALGWVNAKAEGARGDGATDDTAALQAALNACPVGGAVYLPAGIYRTSAPLTQQPYTRLICTHGNGQYQAGGAAPYSSIKPLSTFAGAAVLQILDGQLGAFVAPTVLASPNTGGYQVTSAEYIIEGLTIDGSALIAASVDGIKATGQIQNIHLTDVDVQQVTGHGIETAFNLSVTAGPQAPFCVHMIRVAVQSPGAHGIVLNNTTDSTFLDCYVLGATGFGWWIAGCANSLLVGCRAEWSGLQGYHVGIDNAQMQMVGCSTDRNGQDGMLVTTSGSPAGTLVLTGMTFNRDGRNNGGGGGSYAGLNINSATCRVLASDMTVIPGYDDGGTGVLSPQYGVSATSAAFFSLTGSIINGATAAWHDGGGNTTLLRSPNVVEGVGQATGTSYPGMQLTRTGATVNGTLAVTGATSFTVAPTLPGGSAVALGWVNVKAYGALGDGVTDDTTAIQNAINALGANGGVVYLPATTNGYLLNSAALTLATPGTVLQGDGGENTKLLVGAAFTGTAVVKISAYNCQVTDLSIDGSSSTTTANPVCNGIEITGVRRAKVVRCQLWYINGWAIEALATTGGASSNPLGTLIDGVFLNTCAGGVHLQGNTTQAWAMNCQINNLQFYLGGVTTGASANLDAIRIEDCWDVQIDNPVVWMSHGTGSALHVKGNCAAIFTTALDSLGSQAGPCVLIEDSANGSPQNVQITGGVIQQGTIGLQLTGGAYQIHIDSTRIINNRTHGIQVGGTGTPVHINNCMFNLNGAGATGTNYDLNWSGAATGKVIGCWFGSNIVATGAAGVQQSVAIAAAQAVLFNAVGFAGAAAASTNWFTNMPAGVLEASAGAVNYPTTVTFSNTGTAAKFAGNQALQPAASTSTAISANVLGTDAFDRFRLLGSGAMQIGSGTAARDTTIGRAGAGVGYVTNTLLVGASTALGDNGSGEIQLANAATVPTTNPVGGALLYATGGQIFARDPSGNVYTVTRAATAGGAGSAITGTTALTTLASGITLPAATLAAGQVYRARAWGVLTTSAAVDTFALALYWGGIAGTALMSFGAQTPNGSAVVTNGAWVAEFEMVALSATSVTVTGWDGLNYFFTSETDTTTTVSNVSAQQLAISVTPSASADSITCKGYYFYRVA